ncbi:MAG: chemotaxis protein CheD [Gammaproteobacteria bacterium]|nr:chemotaxis protein CheD [Gammaproteobacteria bacterium]
MVLERRPHDYMEYFLHPGEFQFTDDPDTRFRTLLGSCVAMTMYHPKRHIGGMSHYLLPTRGERRKAPFDGRYADEALLLFLREAIRYNTDPADYEIKLFGGGDMFSELDASRAPGIGRMNIEASLELLKGFGLKPKGRHVGGFGHRVVMLDLWDGAVWVKHQTTKVAPPAHYLEDCP